MSMIAKLTAGIAELMVGIAKPMAGLPRAIFAALLVLILAPLAVAQDAGSALDPYPLRPADTSSPRDTLRSFNASVNQAMQAWHAGAPREAIVRPGQHALETFDFSS